MNNLPGISVIIPTLNAAIPLRDCLKSINRQIYPKNKIEIILVDAGSTDNTLLLAKKFHCKILSNPLKTAEAGKAVGVAEAKNELIALIDSDNYLPCRFWFKKMVEPFIDSDIIGSEPWKFTYRRHSGFIERYSSLIGANDPYAFVTGVYDRLNQITNNWTGLNIQSTDNQTYLKITLQPDTLIPTIGANGTIFRSSFLKNNLSSDYLFDIDLITHVLQTTGRPVYFAKVKTGIVHTYCEASVSKFIRKQKRRLIDYYCYLPLRRFDWQKTNDTGVIRFTLYSLLIFPALFDSFKGFIKIPDFAWFFHPLACILSFYIYAFTTIQYRFHLLKPINRTQWQQ